MTKDKTPKESLNNETKVKGEKFKKGGKVEFGIPGGPKKKGK